MQNSIFHVHTYRCNHMRDKKKEWEYIEKAIELGATEIWFTDHAPFPGDQFLHRMLMEELPEYLSTLRALREKYREKIDVRIGLEIEYLPNYHDYYEMLLESGDYELLLLGQHFALLEDGTYTFDHEDKSIEEKELAAAMIAGMESGFFQVVAHPDQIFRRTEGWNKEREAISNVIKACAARTGVILEKNVSNMSGKKKKRAYRQEFWENLPKEVKTVYGLDAHSVAELEENYLIQGELES